MMVAIQSNLLSHSSECSNEIAQKLEKQKIQIQIFMLARYAEKERERAREIAG
jgi:AAA15 family ATPase/GTPase